MVYTTFMTNYNVSKRYCIGRLDSKRAETMAGDSSREGLLYLNTPWDASGRLGNGTCSGRGTCLLTSSQVPFFFSHGTAFFGEWKLGSSATWTMIALAT